MFIYFKFFVFCRWYWHYQIAFTKKYCNYYFIQIKFAIQWFIIIYNWFKYLMFNNKKKFTFSITFIFYNNCIHDNNIQIDRNVVTNCNFEKNIIRICLNNDRSLTLFSNLFTFFFNFCFNLLIRISIVHKLSRHLIFIFL